MSDPPNLFVLTAQTLTARNFRQRVITYMRALGQTCEKSVAQKKKQAEEARAAARVGGDDISRKVGSLDGPLPHLITHFIILPHAFI